MRGDTLSVYGTRTFVVEECCNCGVEFAMTEEYKAERRRDKLDFHCPNGHQQHYVGITDAERIRRLEATNTHLRDQRDSAERSANAYKGQATKLRRKMARVEKGVCPHCNRSFENLARHMETQHH